MNDQTTESYDRIARRYYLAHKDKRFWKRERKMFIRLLKGNKILDAGCGPGIDAALFVAKRLNVTGIDASGGMVRFARRSVPAAKFRQMDMRRISFPPWSFHGIWCCASLLHIKRPEARKVISRLSKAVKPAGVVAVMLKYGKGQETKTYPDGTKRFFRYYTEPQLEGLIKGYLTPIKVYTTPKDRDGDTWIVLFAMPAIPGRTKS